MKLRFFIQSWNICTYSVYFKSKKELNYNSFVDPNILGASRLVHSDLRIYRISFFLLDITDSVCDTESVIIAIRKPKNPVRGRSIAQWIDASSFDEWFVFYLIITDLHLIGMNEYFLNPCPA